MIQDAFTLFHFLIIVSEPKVLLSELDPHYSSNYYIYTAVKSKTYRNFYTLLIIQPGLVAYAFNPTTGEAEAGISEFEVGLVQDHLVYTEKPCFKGNKTN